METLISIRKRRSDEDKFHAFRDIAGIANNIRVDVRLNIRIVSGKLCGDSFRNDFGNFAHAVPEGGTDTLC